MSDTPRRAPQQPRSFRAWVGDMPRWKKGLVGGALAVAVLGGVWLLVQGGGDATTTGPATGGAGTPPGGAGFLPGGTRTGDPGAAPAASGGEPAAKGVFRLGSSFLIGFCVGAFVRAAVKIAAITVGFFLVGLFLLDQAGFVIVDWAAIDQAWSGFWARVGDEWGDFQQFMTGRLPAAGLVGLGLYTGFKKH